MRTNRVETPGGCLWASNDIRPVFGRNRWAYGAKERSIKSAGVPSCVSAREGCLRCCFRACVACGFVCDDTEGWSSMSWWNVLSTWWRRCACEKRALPALRLEELKFPARWKCCTSTLRVRRITHQVRKVMAKARAAGLFASLAVCRGCLTPTALVSESAGFCLCPHRQGLAVFVWRVLPREKVDKGVEWRRGVFAVLSSRRDAKEPGVHEDVRRWLGTHTSSRLCVCVCWGSRIVRKQLRNCSDWEPTTGRCVGKLADCLGFRAEREGRFLHDSNLVDPASSHTLV